MPIYNLVEYSDNYLKASGSLWQYYRHAPALKNGDAVVNFPGNSALFKFKQKITGLTRDDCTKNVEIMVPSKYLNNFWRTLEMPLLNCEINLTLTWSEHCVISNAPANQGTTFVTTDRKVYVPVLTLSTQDNAKLLHKSKSGFKRTIN